MSDKVAIFTDDAPAPAHSFPQGLRKGPILQVSGQGPVDPGTGEYAGIGDVKAQTALALRNIAAILRAGGASFDDVIMLRVYLTTNDDFAAMNEAYTDFLRANVIGDVLPCRTTVITGLPRAEMSVEIDAQACLD